MFGYSIYRIYFFNYLNNSSCNFVYVGLNAVYLDDKEKVQAIAELFSGERVTAEGLTSAKKFMDQALG